MSKLDINVAVKLFANKIRADIEFFNYMNPECPLTFEDVINQLTPKKEIRDE